MKTFAINKPVANRWQATGGTQAFALIELLVILVVLAMFAAVTLPALLALAAREPVSRAQCVNNLRQIALGWTIYQQEFNQVMPCHWPGYTDNRGFSNPWRTYEAYRVIPGTTQISSYTDPPNPDGPWNLGVLIATGLIPGPRVLYCPAAGRVNRNFSYDYYTTISNTWPSTPVGSGDDKARASYNYYPQLRATQASGLPGIRVPKPAWTPTKWTELDATKSIATDLVNRLQNLSHVASGSIAGLNALFPDGRVVFQTPRNNPEPFDPVLWDRDGIPDNDVYIGNSAPEFRYVMSLWKP
jgi:type II secretory pathway pseudopilin PulG